jgi:hypothetical protein
MTWWWEPGDRALCIKETEWHRLDGSTVLHPEKHPMRGETYGVASVYCAHGIVALRFREFGNEGYSASSFRKIRPEDHYGPLVRKTKDKKGLEHVR